MAQIVTITNPLTGQPAQVDQLDHTAQEIDDAIARSLPGGAIDMALQNNDPRKWGIGANAVIPSGRSANNITADGLYYCDVDTPTGSDWLIYHIQRNEYWAVQLAVCSNVPALGLVIRRKMLSVWEPWEWVNPPMELGVEYRTTERWNEKTVYAMILDFGPLPNNTAFSTDIPGWVSTNRAFSVNVIAHGSTETVPVPVGLSSDYSSSYWYINNANKKLYIRSRVDLSGYTSCYVYIKYTKDEKN